LTGIFSLAAIPGGDPLPVIPGKRIPRVTVARPAPDVNAPRVQVCCSRSKIEMWIPETRR
jgi:hypothetical protein